jgi:hypothetical protein
MRSAKELFQESLPQEYNYRSVIQSRPIETAIQLSLAQCGSEAMTRDQLDGVNRFIEILTTLGDPKPESPPDPMAGKRLRPELLNPTAAIPPRKPKEKK